MPHLVFVEMDFMKIVLEIVYVVVINAKNVWEQPLIVLNALMLQDLILQVAIVVKKLMKIQRKIQFAWLVNTLVKNALLKLTVPNVLMYLV